MDNIMTLDVLSNIKGAKPSEVVEQLFDVIKNATVQSETDIYEAIVNQVVDITDLRNDEVHAVSEREIQLIKNNFPQQKNDFLVVSKVIEE